MMDFGSLAKTGIGHGTDIAGMLGLSGENFKTIDTSKIDEKIDEIKSSNILNFGGENEIPFIYGKHLVLNMDKSLDFHPNGKYTMELRYDKYSINDKAFMYNPLSSDIRRYRIENGRLKYTHELTEDKGWGSLTKIEE